MDSNYSYTMTVEDQQTFVAIARESKYGELLKQIREQARTNSKKQTDFREESSSKIVLGLLNKKMMKDTVSSFPIDLPLNSKDVYYYTPAEISLQVPVDQIYDIRFIMPLLYHAVSPSLLVDCRDFIARRGLALTLTGLSSYDPQMRALCYKILELYYDHLQSSLLMDKDLWKDLLDLIRNSITAQNARIRSIFTTFLTKIIDVLLHPIQGKLYELIKEFLTGRPRFKTDTIEIYDDLLLCADVELYNENLRWLLTLFRDGTKAPNDMKVVVELNVIPQIMCLYNSPLRFDRANETICSIFIRLLSIESGGSMLINEYAFLPWLHQVILCHINQSEEDMERDKKLESLNDTAQSVSSLVFALVDAVLKGNNMDNSKLTLPRLLELINAFITLHDLIIKSKNQSVLAYYIRYVQKVAKAIRKDSQIPDKMASHLLELIRAKMSYLG